MTQNIVLSQLYAIRAQVEAAIQLIEGPEAAECGHERKQDLGGFGQEMASWQCRDCGYLHQPEEAANG